MKHLKKPDGEPLWRKDIQFDFLNSLFRNEQRVFTNAYTKEPNKTFADIYIDAMARSSKCSKVLGERLLSDREAALSIAMVCLLVNIGRINTTLNFFFEMKAQLRTYHPIPSLQASQTAGDSFEYRQLQDAPRLKSILKGACEDRVEPQNFDQLKATDQRPRTNPINLVFVLASNCAQIESELMPEHVKFFDLYMNSSFSSSSRAEAFLYICWACLESELTPESLAMNPFAVDGKFPPLKALSPAEQRLENEDSAVEVAFGQKMLQARIKYLDDTSGSQKKKTPVANVSIPTPTSKLDKRTYYEFQKLLREKRILARRRRYQQSDVKRMWDNMKDIDPVYSSDNELALTEGSIPPGLEQYGFRNSNPTGDYGEYFATMERVFKKLSQS